MKISIIKPGLLSTVQDLGRHLFLSQAVPVSGAMDTLASRVANIALGNDDHCAVIEFTYADVSFKAETDLLIAYSGDGAILISGNKRLPADRPIHIPKGNEIELGNNPAGSRTYLAIAGGFDMPEVLGSKSTYLVARFGGLDGRVLKAGDALSSDEAISATSKAIVESLNGNAINYPKWSIARQELRTVNRYKIRVVPAKEFTWFKGESIINFLSKPYKIGLRSNRMGFHLEGDQIIRNKKEELLSTAVTPGTIQVTGDGTMILLMADCQTTGGYPRIAHVAAVDMPLCAQLKPGDAVYFEEIGRNDAEILYLERERDLRKIAATITNKFLQR